MIINQKNIMNKLEMKYIKHNVKVGDNCGYKKPNITEEDFIKKEQMK